MVLNYILVGCPCDIWKRFFNYVYIRTWIGRKSEKSVLQSNVTLSERENMIQTKKMCMLCSVFRVCNLFESIISFAGSYTEALNDAKMAVELQPSFLKNFVRGRLTLHIPFDNIFFLKKISQCVNIWKLSLHQLTVGRLIDRFHCHETKK